MPITWLLGRPRRRRSSTSPRMAYQVRAACSTRASRSHGSMPGTRTSRRRACRPGIRRSRTTSDRSRTPRSASRSTAAIWPRSGSRACAPTDHSGPTGASRARRTPRSPAAWPARAGSSPGLPDRRRAHPAPTSSTVFPRCRAALCDRRGKRTAALVRVRHTRASHVAAACGFGPCECLPQLEAGREGGMRAVVYDRYAPPESLRVDDLPRPSPSTNQVLLRVFATSINLSDWECLHGAPLYARLGGLRQPARRTLGSDGAGRVESVGAGVTRLRVGDEVYGDNLQLKGGFAEYAVAPETALATKPPELTFAEASTIPQAATIALQGSAGVAAGQRVLINRAGGGSGSFAIQLAKRAGAHVTGVDNAGKLDFMRSLGADAVIDYRSEDFTRREPYDLILDLVAHRSVFAYRRALVPGGRYRCVG